MMTIAETDLNDVVGRSISQPPVMPDRGSRDRSTVTPVRPCRLGQEIARTV
jgi:hypothetical protein